MNSMKIIPSVWKSQSANKVYSSWSKSRHKMSNLNESVKNCNSMARRMTTTLTEAIPDIRQVVIKTLKSMYTFFSETFN
jgi:transcriptional accessory protein Tex/SPT6